MAITDYPHLDMAARLAEIDKQQQELERLHLRTRLNRRRQNTQPKLASETQPQRDARVAAVVSQIDADLAELVTAWQAVEDTRAQV